MAEVIEGEKRPLLESLLKKKKKDLATL